MTPDLPTASQSVQGPSIKNWLLLMSLLTVLLLAGSRTQLPVQHVATPALSGRAAHRVHPVTALLPDARNTVLASTVQQ